MTQSPQSLSSKTFSSIWNLPPTNLLQTLKIFSAALHPTTNRFSYRRRLLVRRPTLFAPFPCTLLIFLSSRPRLLMSSGRVRIHFRPSSRPRPLLTKTPRHGRSFEGWRFPRRPGVLVSAIVDFTSTLSSSDTRVRTSLLGCQTKTFPVRIAPRKHHVPQKNSRREPSGRCPVTAVSAAALVTYYYYYYLLLFRWNSSRRPRHWRDPIFTMKRRNFSTFRVAAGQTQHALKKLPSAVKTI